MEEMVFWGATGHAKVLRECMSNTVIKLVALFDNNNSLISPFPNVPLYYGKKGFDDWLRQRNPNIDVGFLVAIGGDKGKERLELQEYLQSQGLVALLAKHPTAYVAQNVSIGTGSHILVNSAVGVDTNIGRACIVNTGAIIDHECHIGDGCHICPGAHLAGCVVIEDYATVGTGAVILPRIKVGRESKIGAGAVVISDVPDYATVVGNPAKITKIAEPLYENGDILGGT